MYHYASDERCADFSLKMHQKICRPGSARTHLGSLQRYPRLLARFKGQVQGKRKKNIGPRRGQEGRVGRNSRGNVGEEKGGKISPPRSFLKVGAYGQTDCIALRDMWPVVEGGPMITLLPTDRSICDDVYGCKSIR